MTERVRGGVRTAGEVLAVARSAMEQILTADELAAASSRVEEPPPFEHGGAPDPERSRVLPDAERIERGEYWVLITTMGESTFVWLSAEFEETDAELFERIRSQLQDFVAESSFGWGQLRE